MRLIIGFALAAVASSGAAAPLAPHHLIPGGVYDDKGPDGNTIILDAPDGLIVVDTGRHPEHVAKILDFAKAQRRPIAAIVNSHWHMDHVQGNADIRAVYPSAQVYATSAVDGALATFLADGPKGAEARLKDPATPKERLAEVRRYVDRMAHPDSVRPTRPVNSSARLSIAGRTIDVRVAPFAVSEADIWLVIPEERMVVVGDLVVDIVPFMDTACVEGWSKALNDVSAVDFDTLIPGHGAPMSKVQFLGWKSAFDRLVECGRSETKVATCADGWLADAACFISADKKAYAKEAAAYYVEARFRSEPEEQRKFCARLKPRPGSARPRSARSSRHNGRRTRAVPASRRRSAGGSPAPVRRR